MVKGIGSIQKRKEMMANRNMLKHGIAVIEPRTISILQEIKQIVIQTVAGIRATGIG